MHAITDDGEVIKQGPFNDQLAGFIVDGLVPGVVAAVANRDGFISLETLGYADIASKRPMTGDTLFWVASQSKAMTAVAFMTLVDSGRVCVEDPVSKYLPEFDDMRFIAYSDPGVTVVKPLTKPLLVRHLLSHTSGLAFLTRIEQPTLDLSSLRERVLSYTIAPLSFQPGEGFMYSNAGTNTIGRIIEIVTGQSYAEFMQKALFEPLGMLDTTFRPNAAQLARLALSYRFNPESGGLDQVEINQLKYPLDDPARQPVPAGGYFSTALDIARFYAMLAKGGVHEGSQFLSQASVQEMTRKQTGDTLPNGYGFCLDVTEKTFGHGGAYGTGTTVDRASGTISIWMIQQAGLKDGVEDAAVSAFHTAVKQILKDNAAA